MAQTSVHFTPWLNQISSEMLIAKLTHNSKMRRDRKLNLGERAPQIMIELGSL